MNSNYMRSPGPQYGQMGGPQYGQMGGQQYGQMGGQQYNRMGGQQYSASQQRPQSASLELFMQINMAMQFVNQFLFSFKQSEPGLIQIKTFFFGAVEAIGEWGEVLVDFVEQGIADIYSSPQRASAEEDACPIARAQEEQRERRKKAMRTLFWALVVFVVWRLVQKNRKPPQLIAATVPTAIPAQQRRRLNNLALNHLPGTARGTARGTASNLQQFLPRPTAKNALAALAIAGGGQHAVTALPRL
jgi:hypothetical protein